MTDRLLNNTLIIGIDATTNTGYAIYFNRKLTVGRISSKSAYKQFTTFMDVLNSLVVTPHSNQIDVVLEDFYAFNAPNPKTKAMVANMVGGWQALWEAHKHTYGNVTLTLAHVKTVRAFLRKHGENELTKVAVRDACRKWTGLTLSDDETDAIAMVLWRMQLPIAFLKGLNVTRNKKVKL